MVGVSASKSNIAWFKLAEFVSRKEREKALAIYKLLAHSLNDEGLILQLEGDILLSFADEKKAIETYIKAATIYERENKFLPATLIYDQLLNIKPETDYALYNIKLNFNLKNKFKTAKAIEQLIKLLASENRLDQLELLLVDFNTEQKKEILKIADTFRCITGT